MRLYLSVDMEGLAGVAHPHQVSFGPNVDRADYDRSRVLMAAEANAAIEAAFERGATDVVVNDSHWTMRNLRAEDLDSRARLVIGDKALSMTEGVGQPGDGAFDAAAFVGYHAGAGNGSGVIAHTYSSATIQEVRVNGLPHNEAALNAIRLGHHGVPVLGYSTADSLSPQAARQAIGEGMRRAIGRMGEMRPYEPVGPLAGEVDFRLAVHAAYAAVLPEATRLGPRTVGIGAGDGETFFRRFVTLFRLAAAATA